MVELFLSFKISCTNCGVDCIYRDCCENIRISPCLICKICSFRITPKMLFSLMLMNASIKCFTFDCEECGEFNVIDEVKKSALCSHCNEINLFEIIL